MLGQVTHQSLQAAGFLEFLATPWARVILLFTAMGMLIAFGIYVVARFRDAINQDGPAPHEMLTNFRELHSRGDLSDEEFRTIKTQLGALLRDEIKDSDDKG